MKSILEKESQYDLQMRPIRHQMVTLLKSFNPTLIRRGRHAHSSVSIVIGGKTGIIDIQMVTTTWNDMPDSISANYPFELWAYSYITLDRSLGSKNEIYWELPFKDLASNVERFVSLSVKFISGLSNDGFTNSKRLPPIKPDRQPEFNGPRPTRFIE